MIILGLGAIVLRAPLETSPFVKKTIYYFNDIPLMKLFCLKNV